MAQLETSRERARMLADEEQRLTLESEETQEQRNRIVAELDEHSARSAELEESFQKAERTYQHTRGDLDASRAAAIEANKLLAQRASRFQVVRQLVASGEGFKKGTRKVLDGLDDAERFKPGIHGVLAGFIEADRSCARAIETALGGHLQAVLVADEKLADAIISRLTEKRLGQAAILPETFVGHSVSTQMEAVPEGAVGWALDKVKSDPRVSRVIEKLLEKVLIVPNFATALRLHAAMPDVTMVTQAGELLGAEGVIHGGDAGEGNVSVLELQNEVRDLETEVAGLTEAEAAARQRVTDLEAQLSQLQEEVETSRERVQRHKVELSTLQGQLTLATREVESVQTKLENVRWERGELESREQVVHEGRSSLEAELAMARERLEGHEEDQRRLQSQVESSQRDEAELQQSLNELRTSLAVERQAKQAAEAQQQPMEARLSELRELSIRRETEIESFVQRIESAAAENARLAEEVETHQAESEDLAAEIEGRAGRRNELIEAIDKAEAELSESRRRYSKASEQRGREEVAVTKIELRLESLVTTILERHQVELSAFEPDAHALLVCIASQKAQRAGGGRQTFVESEDSEDEEPAIIVVDASKGVDEIPVLPGEMTGEPDWNFVESIVSELKRRLDSMGPVNVDAIEEYEELEERYNDVRSNYDDLVSSKANLIEVIDKINEETQRRFSETFAQVKLNFRDMFKELFGEKGQADLMLIDENDPLESGIEVIAKPPGKKLQSISLLSGGERSMTAVALLFSIYMIKPSPFCVLDELDAPLDESNINRFVKVLDRFIDNSQFIIVTHSKRTMARADVMYGVTMEEFGVSKPVGMRLTSSDDVAANAKGEARTAAQKAALRLDA